VVTTGKLPNPLASAPRDSSRAALVQELQERVRAERKFWKPTFDRIREEQKFAAGKQWPSIAKAQTDEKDLCVLDVMQQMINRKTATLYAKNPQPEAAIAERMNFEVWDGRQETLDAAKKLVEGIAPIAMQAHEAAAAGQDIAPPPPQMTADVQKAQAILQDYEQGMQEKQMLQRVANTATKLVELTFKNQSPPLLSSGKQLVTRIVTSRVGFVKVMFKREMETTATASVNDFGFAERLQALQQKLRELQDAATSGDSAAAAQAQLMAKQIEREQADNENQVKDEGVVYDFLQPTAVIVDRACTCLRDFVGARWIAHEMLLDIAEAEAKFGVSLRDTGAAIYREDGTNGYDRATETKEESRTDEGSKPRTGKVCIWNIEDKTDGMNYVVCDGVKDFLKEPEANDPKVNRFWSIVSVTFNAQEVEVNYPDEDVTIYPRSDVRLAMPMQKDINTAGEGLREHRVANRPAWIGIKSRFAGASGENDLMKLARPRPAHQVIMIENINPGEGIADFIQPLPTKPITPELYSTSSSLQAMMLSTGMQASDLGQQRPDEKATGQQIAAMGRATNDESNIEDLDMLFTTLAQMTFEMLIQEMREDTVKKLVGRGAVWPSIRRQELQEAIFVKIAAGSMGRPNQMAELNNFKVIGPQLGDYMAKSGRDLEPLIKEGVRRLGDKLDVDEFLKPAQLQAPPVDPAAMTPKPSLSLSMNFKDAPPSVQAQIEQVMGFQPAPVEQHQPPNPPASGGPVPGSHIPNLTKTATGKPPQGT
jgi:hypothetical protein